MTKDSGLMKPEEFQKFFTLALRDENFRRELERDGFGALERAGLKVRVPDEIRATLAQIPGSGTAAVSKCGTCGVCGMCSLCGEINLGSGSAFLWATFFLGNTAASNLTSDC